jgi:1,4-dihydroxy-2-naphthoate octaprenyltransferase
VFWGLQAANVLVGVAVALFGMPGFARWPILSYIVAMLLFVHVVQNLSLRQRWIDADRRAQREAEDEALLEQIRRDDDARDREGR